MSFFSEENEKQRAADKAIDAIRNKYGPQVVQRASFLHSRLRHMTGETGEDAEYPVLSSLL
ncbi:DNA polymerase IV [Desulfitobacterium sp. AusDCA]